MNIAVWNREGAGARRARGIAIATMLVALVAGAAQAKDDTRTRYLLYCSGCHLPDGTGSAVNDVPTLHRIPGKLVQIQRGREFLAQVPGIAYTPLDDAQAAEVLNWMLATYSGDVLPDGFVPYTAEEVGRYRAARPADVFSVRRAVLAELREHGVEVDY